MQFLNTLLADNGGYFLAAYAIVFGTLIAYAFRLHTRLAALEQRARGHGH